MNNWQTMLLRSGSNKTGWGTNLLSRAANNNWLCPKILSLSYYEGWRLPITSYLKYRLIMGFRGFVLTRCSALDWVTEILMRVIPATKFLESLRYKGVATFSSGGETIDWSIQLPVIMQEIRSGWWQLVLLMNECLAWLGISWIAWASAEIFPGGWQSRQFACPFQVVDDATQIDLYKKKSNVTATVACSAFLVRKL